jgi:hypothetical protein
MTSSALAPIESSPLRGNAELTQLVLYINHNFEGQLLFLIYSIQLALKVPKREIFHRSDFSDFYTIKSSWVGDLVVKILTYYFNF